MENKLNFFEFTENLKNHQFAALKNYQSQTGQIANYLLNIGLSYDKTVQKSINILKTKMLPVGSPEFVGFLFEIATKTQQSPEIVLSTYNKTLESLMKNQVEGYESAQSLAQKDLYTHLTPCIKVLTEQYNLFASGLLPANELILYIYAFEISKQVITPAPQKTVNRKPETLVKMAIEKALNLPHTKYRNFKISANMLEPCTITANGSTYDLCE